VAEENCIKNFLICIGRKIKKMMRYMCMRQKRETFVRETCIRRDYLEYQSIDERVVL